MNLTPGNIFHALLKIRQDTEKGANAASVVKEIRDFRGECEPKGGEAARIGLLTGR